MKRVNLITYIWACISFQYKLSSIEEKQCTNNNYLLFKSYSQIHPPQDVWAWSCFLNWNLNTITAYLSRLLFIILIWSVFLVVISFCFLTIQYFVACMAVTSAAHAFPYTLMPTGRDWISSCRCSCLWLGTPSKWHVPRRFRVSNGNCDYD